MRKFVIVAAVIIVILLVGFVITAIWGSSQRPAFKPEATKRYVALVDGTYVDQSKPPRDHDIERVPSYPKVDSITSVITRSNPIRNTLCYDTPDNFDQVLGFYKTALPEEGWTQLFDDLQAAFEWRDATGALPWGLYVHILVTGREPSGTNVCLTQERWPDTTTLLVYPRADQIDTTTFQAQSTTYEVRASLEDIEAYYKATLAQHGWEFVTTDSRSIEDVPGLKFRSMYPNVKNLSIVAKQDANGIVRVVLTLEQSELLAPE
jgi:hypothetical protein